VSSCLDNDLRLTTIYEIQLQENIARGILPDFQRLRQLCDEQVDAYLVDIRQQFLSRFSSNQSITLNQIFDDFSSFQRQLARFEQRLVGKT
jgi:hypothetical protein